jgi:hypothetical protein
MSRIITPFTITNLGIQLKLTFANTYNTIIWPSNSVIIIQKFGNIFSIGIPSNMITLDYTKSTTNPESLSVYLLSLHTMINTSGSVRIYGRNDAVGASSEDIWIGGGNYNFLQTASVLEILSENIEDAGVTGAGARTVRINGLDANYDEITELVSLIGNTTSLPTTLQFLRVNNASVSSIGTPRGSNFNNLTIRVPTANTVVAVIDGGYGDIDTSEYGIGISQLGIYTVPRNNTAYIVNIEVNIESNKSGDINLYTILDTSVETNTRQIIWKASNFSGHISSSFISYYEVPAKSDIWLRGKAANGSKYDTIIDLILLNNN